MKKILSLVLGLMWVLPVWGALPSGYTQLEYIESTGTQSIDTGIEVNASKLTSGMRMELDIQFLSTNRQNGGNGVTTGPYFWIAYYHPGQLYCGLGNLYPSITVSQNVFSRHSYVLDSALKNFYIDDVLVESYDISAYNGTKETNITLFSIGTSFYVKQKLYKASIYQANNLVGNFIPAKRNSDGAVGLYDTVSGEFFENSGTGEFVAGPVVEIKIATTKYNESAFSPLNTALANAISVVDSVVSNTITQAGRIATLQAQKQTRPNDIADDNEKCPAGKKCLLVEDASGTPHWYEIVENAWDLPVGYTQLQYIESTGEQYLDLGYAISKTMSFEIKSRCLGASFVFGGRASSSSAVSGMNYDLSVSKIGIRMGSVILYDTLVWQEGTDYTVSIQNGNVSIDGRTVSSATYGNDYYTGKAYLFAANDNGHLSPTVYNKNRIYYFKMYNNNTLTQNLIPAKNSSGVVGMYDTVEGRFFENAGTGDFIAGPVAE